MKKTISVLLLPLLLAGFTIVTSNSSCSSCKKRSAREQKKIEISEADTILKSDGKESISFPYFC